MSVVAVDPDRIDDVWELARKHIARANGKIESGFSVDDLKQKIVNGKNQLWWINDGQAAAITAIINLPLFRLVRVTYLGGAYMHEWMDEFAQTIERFGRDNDCKYFEASGRKGWARFLNSYGADLEYVVLRKKL